jgi:hypothetical protein
LDRELCREAQIALMIREALGVRDDARVGSARAFTGVKPAMGAPAERDR